MSEDYTYMDKVYCPYCGHEQLDHHNGGDPAYWWDVKYIPYAENVEAECDSCRKPFLLNIEYEASFSSFKIKKGAKYE